MEQDCAGLRAVAALLLVMARGYQHLTQFRCAEVRSKVLRASDRSRFVVDHLGPSPAPPIPYPSPHPTPPNTYPPLC